MSSTGFRPVRLSAMYHAHRALGATFRDDGDWRVPDVYTAPRDEAAKARAGVGLADMSACGKLSVRGEAVEGVLAKVAGVERMGVAMAERVRVDGARVLAARLADDELLFLVPVAETAAVAEVLGKAAGGLGCAHVTDLTGGLAVVDLIGPRAFELLARLSPLDLAAVPVLAVVPGELARVHATLIRLDRPPSPAFRAVVAREYGAFVWDALAEAGRDLDLTPVGAAARALLEEDSLASLGGPGPGAGGA